MNNRVNRKGISVVLVVLALASLLFACSAPAPGASSAPATGTSGGTGTTPKGAYGDLHVGLSTFARANLDPAFSGPSVSYLLSSAIFDSLLGVTQDGKVAPDLAERWDISPDAKTWTFYVRKGVKFQDGSDLTAADVKFSIDRVLQPDATSIYAGVFRQKIDSVAQKDDYTVVLSLKQADLDFWRYLVPVMASEGLIVPKGYVEAKGVDYFRSHMVGSGPWKFVKYDTNVELQLEAVDNHWRTTPQFKNLTITKIGENATRLAMLKTRQLDMIDITPAMVPEVKAAGLRVMEHPGASQSTVVYLADPKNLSASPIGDLRVRKALSLAINRQEIANTIFAGAATPSRIASQGGVYVDPNMKPDPYDLAQAKNLLAEAGYPNGFSINLFSSRTAIWTDVVAEAVAGYWDKIGVKATIKTQDFAALVPLIQQASPQVMGSAVVMLGTAMPAFNGPDGFSSKGIYRNQFDPQVDALIAKAAAALDPTERQTLGRQAITAARDSYTGASLVDISDLYAVGKTLGEWKPVQTPVSSIPAREYELIPHAK